MSQSAAQRDIPPELVYRHPDLPSSVANGAAFLVDKPRGVSSFGVVKQIRECTGVSKVGHAGTLDPLATGLLIVLVARSATRLQEAFVHLPKVYVGTMRLGEETPSFDTETEVVETRDVSFLTRSRVESACRSHEGSFWQTPPMYSAVKVKGERLYEKARRGESVDRPPRRVRVDAFDVREWASPDLRFCVRCSRGTYVRALARDVGKELGVGAHLRSLRRRAVGAYSAERAWPLSPLVQALSNDNCWRS